MFDEHPIEHDCFDEIDARELGCYIGFCSNVDDFIEEDY